MPLFDVRQRLKQQSLSQRPVDLDYQQRLRAAFDPDGAANPRKVLPLGSRCGDVQALPTGVWV